MSTPEEIRQEFAARGISISAWARWRGFSVPLVYQVLNGKRRALRGQSHEIAVALGLKDGLPLDFTALSFENKREDG